MKPITTARARALCENRGIGKPDSGLLALLQSLTPRGRGKLLERERRRQRRLVRPAGDLIEARMASLRS